MLLLLYREKRRRVSSVLIHFTKILNLNQDLRMENDIDKVIEVTESPRARSKGRYFENIAEICHESFGWDEEKTTAMLNKALSEKKIFTAIAYNKLSYRKCENRKICIEYNSETTSTQTDTLSSEFIPKSKYE